MPGESAPSEQRLQVDGSCSHACSCEYTICHLREERDQFADENGVLRAVAECTAIEMNDIWRRLAIAERLQESSEEGDCDGEGGVESVANYGNASVSTNAELVQTLESMLPPATYVEQQYEWERAASTYELGLHELQMWLAHQFKAKFELAGAAKKQPVIVEMVARGDVLLEDPAESLVDIGNIGAHCLRYYTELEIHLATRRKTANEFWAHLNLHTKVR